MRFSDQPRALSRSTKCRIAKSKRSIGQLAPLPVFATASFAADQSVMSAYAHRDRPPADSHRRRDGHDDRDARGSRHHHSSRSGEPRPSSHRDSVRDPAPKEGAPRPAAAPAADPLPPPPSMPPPPAKKAEAEIDRAKVSSRLHNGFVALLSCGDPAPKHGDVQEITRVALPQTAPRRSLKGQCQTLAQPLALHRGHELQGSVIAIGIAPCLRLLAADTWQGSTTLQPPSDVTKLSCARTDS